MDRIEVGKHIKELREKRNWRKGTLATQAGLAPSYIPVLENGEKSPTVETLESICFALGVTLSQFFLEDEKKELLNKQESLLLQKFRSLSADKKDALIKLL